MARKHPRNNSTTCNQQLHKKPIVAKANLRVLRSLLVEQILLLAATLLLLTNAYSQKQPNIIFILTDDMGYGDISCFNGTYKTPNIDRMASEGKMFTKYYSASPICSPSRVGLLTGMAPAKWKITSFLQKKADNKLCEQVDFLNPAAPTTARILKAKGYATGHFGKWHMGGGRDVDDAPSIKEYGFDEWSSTWESPDPDPVLTATDWIWSDKDSIKRWSRTAYFVDKTLSFLQKHRGRPCFINLWPDDMHTPWVPGDGEMRRFAGKPEDEKSFIDVLYEYDRQIGRLMRGIKDLGLDENTLVVFTSDNGPLPNFRNERSAGMRGTKLSLYDGGIRMPFIVRWPGHVTAGTTDSSSIVHASDMLPTFCKLGGAILPKNYVPDGEDKTAVMLGKPAVRKKPIYWEYGRNDISFKYPPDKYDKSPSLAIREGKWKLLMQHDGSGVELYNMTKDENEKSNLAAKEPSVTKELTQKLLTWWKSM
ncbi:MAG: sulfatase-like hydrolase/transferase [Chitinophagaceae bacterium]